jgi:hypothetical protein
MQYQLVIQFKANSLDDFDSLIRFEDELRSRIGDSAEVDGHDFGSGELNIFVVTDHPESTFQDVQKASASPITRQSMAVAYRKLTEQGFSILWPPNLKDFRVS